MRYWKVSLLGEGRTTREWHVRTEILTVGSNGANAVRLPPPVEPFALRLEDCEGPSEHAVGPYLLRVEDETEARGRLWSQAQSRIELAKEAFAEAPSAETHVPTRMAAAALALVGLTNLAANLLVDDRHDVVKVLEHRSAVAAPVSPRPAYSADSQSAPVLFAAPAASAPRLVALGPSLLLGGQAGTSGSAVAAVLAAMAFAAPCAAGSWTSRPPSRYRAPWPDAPVPPH